MHGPGPDVPRVHNPARGYAGASQSIRSKECKKMGSNQIWSNLLIAVHGPTKNGWMIQRQWQSPTNWMESLLPRGGGWRNKKSQGSRPGPGPEQKRTRRPPRPQGPTRVVVDLLCENRRRSLIRRRRGRKCFLIHKNQSKILFANIL